jgi:hypothetical protein
LGEIEYAFTKCVLANPVSAVRGRVADGTERACYQSSEETTEKEQIRKCILYQVTERHKEVKTQKGLQWLLR